MPGINETETVIRKILPYLERREYDIQKDLDFETAVNSTDRYSKGYADIIIRCGQPVPLFVIEAKRSGRVLSDKDKEQALEYGAALGCLFVVVTNGTDIRCFNVANGKPVAWNGKLIEKIPTRTQAFKVVSLLKANKDLTDIPLRDDKSLPYRPGLPFKQLNALFYRCHSAIREMEKNEDEAFSDFSKMLFLKLLEEKADVAWAASSGTKSPPLFELPYSTRFHELAKYSENESDKVLAIVKDMIEKIREQETYKGVLPANL